MHPLVNLRRRLQAFSTSKSSFLTSRDLIRGHLGLVHRFLEVRIPDRIKLHQIDWCLEKSLDLFSKAKVVVRVFHRRHRPESDEEVEVSDVGEGASS